MTASEKAPGSPEWRSRLAEWMRSQGCAGDSVADVRPITGGTQNLLLRFRFGDTDYVLRQPPPGAVADVASTVGREARFLGALGRTPVPHPRLVGAETESCSLGDAFLVTEFVPGFNALEELPPHVRHGAAEQRAIAHAVADAALRLATVDPDAIGLSGLGRAQEWPQRQVARWTRVLEGYHDVAGYEDSPLARAVEVGERLVRRFPGDVELGLTHGDLHVGNMLVAEDGRRVAAIVDWELATVGDVRLDLAHLVVTWPGTLASWPAAAGWTCTDSNAVIVAVADEAPHLLEEFAWFRLFAAYRMAILLEGSRVRSLLKLGDRAVGSRLHAVAVELIERALEFTS